MAAMDECCFRCTECDRPACEDPRCNNYRAAADAVERSCGADDC